MNRPDFYGNLLKQKVLERTRAFAARRSLHNHSFWNIACIYYRVDLPRNGNLLIGCNPNWYFTPFTFQKMKDFKKYVDKNLKPFLDRNKKVNEEPQRQAPKITRGSTASVETQTDEEQGATGFGMPGQMIKFPGPEILLLNNCISFSEVYTQINKENLRHLRNIYWKQLESPAMKTVTC